MAFDFEGLAKPKNSTAQGNIADRLPSGLRPVAPDAKKEDSFSLPTSITDYASNMGIGKSILTVGEAVIDTAKQTNAYKKYMYSDEEKLAEAKKISIETGIAENVLIANDDNLAKGREMFNFRRKQMALAPQGLNDFDIQQIYDAYPALGKLKDDTEMAIGFSHIENIKQTKGIVEAAQTGLETAKLMRDYSAIGNKAVYGGTLTDDDWKKAQEIEGKLKEAKFFPDFGDSPLANVIGNTAQQTYRYGPSVLKGAGAGLALGAVGGVAGSAGGLVGAAAGAKYGFGLGFKIGTMADMFDETAGSRFMEYASLKDKQGNRLLSDADARLFTIVEAGAETGIEFWNYNSIMNMLGGSIHRKAIKDIVANAAGNNEAIKAGILNYAKGVAKVAGTVYAEELPEEAVQDVVEKGTWNVITGKYATNNNYKQYSGKEMLDSAGNAMVEAAPSVAGFSIMAGAGSTVSGVRSFARMAAIRKTYTDNEIQVANGVDMVSQLQENKAENDLYKKQPDIYEKVLHNELDGTVYAQTRVDTELALADEETAKVFYQLAQDAGYEQEDINAIVENGADLVVPTELYASKVDNGKMNTFIKFGEGTESIARQAQMKELYQRELEGFMDKEEGKQADLIDTLIATAFPNAGPEQDLGAEIILSYPSDPANGWKAERNSAQNNIDNRLEPIYSKLREGMKQGVQTIAYGEDGQRIRVSKNDQWYSDFYKEHKRPPTKAELQDIAIDIYKGNGAKYGFTDWEANTAELADAFKSHADELQTELDRVNLLDSIKPNLLNLSRAELGVMKGLSKEAVKVYQTVSKLADTATSKKAKQSVKTTAILLARHADRIAEIARQSGMKDFTAEDYFSRMKFDFSGQGESLFKGGETVNQTGDITKTPAFIKWFKNSKVVDENGKPLILYHGTRNSFNSFVPSKGGEYGPGIYIADMQETAKWYADNVSSGTEEAKVLPVYVSMQNPFYVTKADYVKMTERSTPKTVMNRLKKQGYDGIIGTGINGYEKQYIAFSPTQIKSVDNAGTFDENNANIYMQSINGSTTFLQSGERIIRLFETADQSTLAHELGHNFLADILYWGKQETAPAWLKADYDTVTKYINYDGVSEVTTEQHEKFARGFEAYLRNGEAPIKGLRGVFRKFKKWMVGLYKDFTDLGGLPSAEVRAVMDRMLVSEQEVEDEAKLQQYENGLKTIGKIVSTSDAQMYARWQNEAKEEAKEKTLAVAMKETSDSLPKQRTDEIAQYEKDIREQLSEQDVFRVEAILKNNNDLTLLPALGYTEESYKEALAKAGGGLEQAVQKAVADFTKDYDAAPMSKEAIREQAEKAMRDGNYNDMLVGFELEAMRAKAEEGNIANDKAVKKIEEIIAAMNGEEADKETDEPAKVKSLKQKIADLRYSFKWTQAEERMIQENKLAELKKQIKDKKTQVRVLKSRVQASVTWTKDIAQDRLKRLPLAEVMATKMWINLAKKSSQDALKAIKKEKWDDALKYKQQQLIYTIMASESTKIKDKVNKIVARNQKRSSNMAQGKTKMPVNERYYFNHLLYVFGINRRDALEPVDGAESFLTMVKRFADNYEANFTDEDGNVGLPNWVLTAIGGKEVYGSRTENPLYADVKSQRKPSMGYEALKLQDFLAINDLLSTIYTVGKNADKLRTIKTADGKTISVKDVVENLITSITFNVMIEANEDTTGATKKNRIESVLEKGNNLLLDLVKMETIFDQIDGGKENGPAMTFIYNVANEARNKEKRMQIEATTKIENLFKAYSAKETRAMINDKKYKFGTSILTKEQVICLALNSGTKLNKKRILDGYHVGELTLNETLSNLTEKDWSLVHGIWELMNSYWEETVGVEERMTGVGLTKQEALPFTITGKDGNVYKVAGGYYPIQYDPTKSVKAAEQQEDDITKQLRNDNAIFGTRIGFTKERNKTAQITRPVLLTFDVIPRALDNVIHNISHREMVRDINRIVTNKDFQDAMVEHFGINTYRLMKQWVKDNWAQEKKAGSLDKIASYLRRNMTAAVLGWRATTALLNVLNIFPMSEYLGAANASKAVKDFYLSPMLNRQFVTSKSVFMADRVNTMDRDMREVTKNLEGKANPIVRFTKNESFRVIAETDLMLAMPLWLTEYKRVFQEGVTSKADVETIERNAVAAGDKAVRRIFGSGEIHDLSKVQKGNELEKMLTMFYSYFNVVFNALSRKNRTGSRYDLARSFLYWIVLTSVGESLIRSAINGDDEDKLLKKMGKNVISQSLGMVPVARDVFVGALDLMFNDKSYSGAKVSSIYDGFTRFTKAAKTGYKLANDEGNKDWLDLMQESVKASNAFTGISDTATDALFTTMRYIETDFDAEIGDYLKAIVFDKKLEK